MTVTKMPGTTISDNTIVDFYKKQVQKLIFIRTNNAQAAAAISKGIQPWAVMISVSAIVALEDCTIIVSNVPIIRNRSTDANPASVY